MLKITEIIEEEINSICNRYNIPKEKILWATSFCSDELNHNLELFNVCGAAFQLGGLAGYPYSGVTGCNAFFDHVPDDGAAIIIYGPHIGKCTSGKTGYVNRPYQRRSTPTCGALWGILNDAKENKFENTSFNANDLQFQFLTQILRENSLKNDYQDIELLTHKMYEIIHEKIHSIIEQSIQKKYDFPVFYIGGIMINTSDTNYFDIKHRGEYC